MPLLKQKLSPIDIRNVSNKYPFTSQERCKGLYLWPLSRCVRGKEHKRSDGVRTRPEWIKRFGIGAAWKVRDREGDARSEMGGAQKVFFDTYYKHQQAGSKIYTKNTYLID